LAKVDRLKRLLNRMLVIQNHPDLSGEKLANRCGVGERQFFRDLQVLSVAGVSIYSDQGYRMVEKFMIKNVSLSLKKPFL
jgi:predicted DNA-binding transcriptional regulator YafY